MTNHGNNKEHGMSLFNEMMQQREQAGAAAPTKPAPARPQKGSSVDDLVEQFRAMGKGEKPGGGGLLGDNGDLPETVSKESPRSAISDNPLRPTKLEDFVGQQEIKDQLRRYIDAALANNDPMLHTLLAAKAGQGKTTLALIIAEELKRDVYFEQCPIHNQRLLELAAEMRDGDVLVLDEVHLQARGHSAKASPETLYHIMEDKIIQTEQGPVQFPDITIIGATTDEGMLPTSFRERFPLTVVFRNYNADEMRDIAYHNGKKLGQKVHKDAADIFGNASLGTPRTINNMVKQAATLAKSQKKSAIDADLAKEVLKYQRVEEDGLTFAMIEYLRALGQTPRWNDKEKRWVYKASLKTMAQRIERARDIKFVEYEVEPTLSKRGFILIDVGGRFLTETGLDRIGLTPPAPPKHATSK